MIKIIICTLVLILLSCQNENKTNEIFFIMKVPKLQEKEVEFLKKHIDKIQQSIPDFYQYYISRVNLEYDNGLVLISYTHLALLQNYYLEDGTGRETRVHEIYVIYDVNKNKVVELHHSVD